MPEGQRVQSNVSAVLSGIGSQKYNIYYNSFVGNILVFSVFIGEITSASLERSARGTSVSGGINPEEYSHSDSTDRVGTGSVSLLPCFVLLLKYYINSQMANR